MLIPGAAKKSPRSLSRKRRSTDSQLRVLAESALEVLSILIGCLARRGSAKASCRRMI